MEEISKVPNIYIKTIKINEGEDKYECKIQTIKNFLQVSIYSENILKQEGSIHLTKIQNQIYAFADYTINDILEEINLLDNDNFSIIKDDNKCKLKIEFIILRRKKFIYIDIMENENLNLNKDDLVNTISELKLIIKNQNDKIKKLEEELNKYKSSDNQYNDNSYDNFNIKLKEPKYKLNYHTNSVNCSTILKDGRIVTGGYDNCIIIYNRNTFKPDFQIKEHSSNITCLIQLKSGFLASCSNDKKIKLYDINGNEYKVLQTLTYHNGPIWKILELKNKKLISCSVDKSLIFYFKNNDEYVKDYSISTNGSNFAVVQTKDNEICFAESDNQNQNICFFDLYERKNITKINNVSVTSSDYESMIMITKDLLLATGENKLSIININTYNLIRTIDVSGSGWITTACILNKDMLLTADCNKRIIQWRIEGDNLKLISKKENAHDNSIYILSKIGNGLILSGSSDNFAKIW